MKSRIYMCLLLFVLSSGCGACGLAIGDLKDAQKASIQEKRFMKRLELKGIVLKKEYCDECYNRGKYRIFINLKETDPKEIEFSFQNHEPDYSFDTANKELNISVIKDLYE